MYGVIHTISTLAVKIKCTRQGYKKNDVLGERHEEGQLPEMDQHCRGSNSASTKQNKQIMQTSGMVIRVLGAFS
jgi:hypothetical protein